MLRSISAIHNRLTTFFLPAASGGSTCGIVGSVSSGNGGRQVPSYRTKANASSSCTTEKNQNHHKSTLGHLRASSSSPEPLLLEGERYCVSLDGVARTFYQLVPASVHEVPPVAIEEDYTISKGHKIFVVRREETGRSSASHSSAPHDDAGGFFSHVLHSNYSLAQNLAPLGPKIASVELQELPTSSMNQAGTGAMTWESSIAMALYFSAHPWMLQGDICELGSGVGLGGILADLCPRFNHSYSSHSVHSITLTDNNDAVIRQCHNNVEKVFGLKPQTSGPDIHVSKLDWNDFLKPQLGHYHDTFDTIIACDCAYRRNYQDIAALSYTMKQLLKESNPDAKIHLFGPHDRAALHDVVRLLTTDERLNMEVEMNVVQIARFRLKPAWKRSFNLFGRNEVTANEVPKELPPDEDRRYASKSVSKFLHVTISHKRK